MLKNVFFSDFENTVNANREAAERALIEVDRINEIIQQAKEKTDQAREAMTGADTSAQLALNVALEGEKIVKEPSEKDSIIKEKAVECQKYALFFLNWRNFSSRQSHEIFFKLKERRLTCCIFTTLFSFKVRKLPKKLPKKPVSSKKRQSKVKNQQRNWLQPPPHSQTSWRRLKLV